MRRIVQKLAERKDRDPQLEFWGSSFMHSFEIKRSDTNLPENIISFIKKIFSAAQSEMSFEEKNIMDSLCMNV